MDNDGRKLLCLDRSSQTAETKCKHKGLNDNDTEKYCDLGKGLL